MLGNMSNVESSSHCLNWRVIKPPSDLQPAGGQTLILEDGVKSLKLEVQLMGEIAGRLDAARSRCTSCQLVAYEVLSCSYNLSACSPPGPARWARAVLTRVGAPLRQQLRHGSEEYVGIDGLHEIRHVELEGLPSEYRI